MRIKNNLGYICYFPYAGTSERGIDLGVGKASQEISAAKLNNNVVIKDINRGIIEVFVWPEEKAVLNIKGLNTVAATDKDMAGMLKVLPSTASAVSKPAVKTPAPAQAAKEVKRPEPSMPKPIEIKTGYDGLASPFDIIGFGVSNKAEKISATPPPTVDEPAADTDNDKIEDAIIPEVHKKSKKKSKKAEQELVD